MPLNISWYSTFLRSLVPLGFVSLSWCYFEGAYYSYVNLDSNATIGSDNYFECLWTDLKETCCYYWGDFWIYYYEGVAFGSASEIISFGWGSEKLSVVDVIFGYFSSFFLSNCCYICNNDESYCYNYLLKLLDAGLGMLILLLSLLYPSTEPWKSFTFSELVYLGAMSAGKRDDFLYLFFS